MNEAFESKNIKLDFVNKPKDDDRMSCKVWNLQWHLSIVMRPSFIDSINIHVHPQSLNVEYELYNEDSDDYEPKTETIDISEFEVEADEYKWNSCIIPDRVEIDLKTKKAIVYF